MASARHGAGFTADSAWYVATARTLARGEGFTAHAAQPFVNWPPLFPLTLALPAAAGVDALVAARWLNALAIAAVVTLGCVRIDRCIDDPVVRTAAVTSMALAVPLIGAGAMVWSEPLFLVLAMLAIWCLETRSDDWRGALVAGVLVGLATSTRYVGVVLVAVGVVALIRAPGSVRARLGRAAGFSVVALTPLALWLARNARLTGTLTGDRAAPHVTLGDQGWALIDALGRWWLPARIPPTPRLAVIALVFAGLAAAMVLERRTPRLTPGALFVVLYVGALLASVATTAVDRIDDRLLAPLYVVVMIGGWALVDRVTRRLGPSRRTVVRVLVACWMLYPVVHATADVAQRVTVGAGGYNRDPWRHADVIEWIRGRSLPGPVVSNDPDALYLLTGVEATPIASHPASARTVVLFERATPPPRAVSGTALFAGRDGTVTAVE